MQFSQEQNAVWEQLYARQLPRIRRHACRAYQEGFGLLSLPGDRVPSLEEVNRRLVPSTGWRAVRTHTRYSDAVPWYRAFARRRFLITDYMRTWDELDFTPEPDMFAPAFLNAPAPQREYIKRLAWFSTEFGLILEDGVPKIFGAGLISSSGEMDHVMAGRVPLRPFTIENVIGFEKAIYNFNEVLFVFESVEALACELGRYFDAL